MNTEEPAPWSRSQLRKLGEALLNKCTPPEGCPDYDTVMLWHSDLADEVAGIIKTVEWTNRPTGQFAVTARSKTVDTLVQKLQRSTLKLDRVQDLAGVRIDAEMHLTHQTRLAAEIADYFGAERVTIRDLRLEPHSGYRAVHLWLVLPAGRVEVQIRTIHQSLWANVYEGIADIVGRGIRYGETHEDPTVQELVQRMHTLSDEIEHDAQVADQVDRMTDRLISTMLDPITGRIDAASAPDPKLIDEALDALNNSTDLEFLARLHQSAEQLRELRRILDRDTEED